MSGIDPTIADLRGRDGVVGTELDSDVSAGAGRIARRALPPDLAVDYEIVGIVGYGSQAEVYQCRPRLGGIDVAIKLYTSPNHRLNADVTRLIESADPAHVLATRFGASGSEQWEVQELIHAGTLADLGVAGTQLDADLLRSIVAESTVALAFAHQLGLLHRDLKPSNILVRRREPLDLVLADFGLARELIAGAEVGSTSHTPGYASPEALRDEIHDFPGDWWSLGITLFEVAAGRHPFADADGRRWSDYKIGSFLERQDVDTSVLQDERVRLLLRGLLTRDPRHRWAYAQVQDWLNGGAPPVVVPAEPRSTSQHWSFAGFLGRVFETPESLGGAMLDNWSDATRFLGDRRSASALHDALAQTPQADQVHRAFERYARNLIGLDGLVFELGRILSPSRSLTFRGIELSNEGLGGVARRAAEGDPEAGGWIKRLHKERVLQQTMGHPDYGSYVEIDARLDSLLAELPRMVQRATPVQEAWFGSGGSDARHASRADLAAIVHGQSVEIQGRILMVALDPGIEAVFAQSAAEASRGPGWIGVFAAMSVAQQHGVLRNILVPALADASRADFLAVEAARNAREQQAEHERIARREAERARAGKEARKRVSNHLPMWGVVGIVYTVSGVLMCVLHQYARGYGEPSIGDITDLILLPLIIGLAVAFSLVAASDYYLGYPARTPLALLFPIAVWSGWPTLDAGYRSWGLPIIFGALGYAAAALVTRSHVIERIAPSLTTQHGSRSRKGLGIVVLPALVALPIIPAAMLWSSTSSVRWFLFQEFDAFRWSSPVWVQNIYGLFAGIDRSASGDNVWWVILAGWAVVVLLFWGPEDAPLTRMENSLLVPSFIGLVSSVLLLWSLYVSLILLAFWVAISIAAVGLILWFIGAVISSK